MKNSSPHRKRQFLATLAAVALPAALTPLPATAAVMDIAKVVTTGDSAPDGNGIFPTNIGNFNNPRLNNAGQAAFTGKLFGSTNGVSDDSGIFRGTTTVGSLVTIAREGLTAGTFSDLFSRDFAQNNAGQVAFLSSATGSSLNGIFRSDGTTTTEMIRQGDSAPIPIGSFSSFGVPLINDAGQIAVVGFLTGTFGGGSDNSGVFRSDGTTITQIAREGQAAPGGGGPLFTFEQMSFNNAGQTAFISNAPGQNDGVFRGDGTAFDALARSGEVAPDGEGGSFDAFSQFSALAFNDAGQTAFLGFTNGIGATNTGVFRRDAGQTVEIVRESDPTPTGNGKFFGFGDNIINNAGLVAFEATSLTGTTGGTTDNAGLFLGNGVTVTEAVREGDAIPGQTGSFENFITFAFNEAGQLAFFADIDLEDGGATLDSKGLFVFDGSDIIEIIRLEDLLFGSEVTALDFVGGEGTLDNARSGFNDLGQVAFRFELLNTIGGIAIADPGISNIPEPATLSLLMIGGLALLRRRVV